MAERSGEKGQECYMMEQVSSEDKFCVTVVRPLRIQALAVKQERGNHQSEICRINNFEMLVYGVTRLVRIKDERTRRSLGANGHDRKNERE